MFRNFGKVFSFSLHNQTGTKSYKVFTIVMGLILLIAPIVIMLIVAGIKDSKEEEDEPIPDCGAEEIYVVSDFEAKPDFMLLSGVTDENYKKIRYKLYDSVDEALDAAGSSKKSVFVLHFFQEDDYIRADIILPDKEDEGEAVLSTSMAEHYFEFMNANSQYFNMLLTGLNQSKLAGLMPQNSYRTYTESGYANGVTMEEDGMSADELIRDQILEVFQILMPYLTIMLMYFLILTYGNATAQAMVMEKESKLMDTMLISVHPEALVFGKLLAIICSGLIQLFSWIACLVVGLVAGTKLSEMMFPDYASPVATFFEFIEELGLFKPVNVVLAVCFLIVGFIMYLSLATIAGAISSNREEVASQSTIFVMPLLAAFMLVMMGGGLAGSSAPAWMNYVPFTAALLMPSQLALGVADALTGAISLAISLALTIAVVIIAGKLYKAMSLYKGNKIKLGDAIKLLTTKEA